MPHFAEETLLVAKLDDGCEFVMVGRKAEPLQVIEHWQVGIQWIECPHGLKAEFKLKAGAHGEQQ